jgi:hypothetical protein
MADCEALCDRTSSSCGRIDMHIHNAESFHQYVLDALDWYGDSCTAIRFLM